MLKKSKASMFVLMGCALLIVGNVISNAGSTQILSDRMSKELVGGPASGCKHKCENGACCDDSENTCDEVAQSECDVPNPPEPKYNTNQKRDWVCTQDDNSGACDATQDKEDCAEFHTCYWDSKTGSCQKGSIATSKGSAGNGINNEAMKCTDNDGNHSS